MRILKIDHYFIEQNILDYCKEYFGIHGYAPSFQEIADGVGIKSKATVNVYMKKLIEEGSVETEHPGKPRAFRVVG